MGIGYVMDNFQIDVTARGDEAFQRTMELAFGSSRAEAYVVLPDKGLVFLWSAGSGDDVTAIPFKMDAHQAAEFALGWLSQVDYGRQPDHDGSNIKGWRVYNEAWGKVGNYTYAVCAIQPAWAMLGK